MPSLEKEEARVESFPKNNKTYLKVIVPWKRLFLLVTEICRRQNL